MTGAIALKMQQFWRDITAERLKLRLICSNIVSPPRCIFNNFPSKNIDNFFSEAHWERTDTFIAAARFEGAGETAILPLPETADEIV